MSNEIELKNANCTYISLLSDVKFEQLKGDNGEIKTKQFKIEAFTGQVINRWWGKLAIDIDGIKAKNNMPILLNHEISQIVGYSDHVYKAGSFFVNGRFSGVTEQSKYVQALAGEGFPWQASIGVKPIRIKRVEKGESFSVNGQEINGEAEIWLESEVFETSFVPLGADSETNAQIFSIKERDDNNLNQNNKEAMKMAQELETQGNIEQLQRDIEQLKTDLTSSHQAELSRVFELAKLQFGETEGVKFAKLAQSGITVEQFQAVKELEEPKKQADQTLKTEILAAIKADSVDIGVGGNADNSPKTFQDAWQMLKKEGQLSTEDAMKKAAREYPELYKKLSKGGK